MKNAYAKEQAELRRQLLNYGALVGQQFNVDMMCLALNEEGFGHDRIMRIIHRAEKHGEYFHECLAYGVESDARFEQLDQRLRYICRDHPEDFVPREERYPNVKVPGMGKKIQSGTDRRMSMKNEEIVRALRATESRSKRELLDAAADLIEKLTARCARYAEEIAVAQERQRWIYVTERLPEPPKEVE